MKKKDVYIQSQKKKKKKKKMGKKPGREKKQYTEIETASRQ
jgi:hypothetical protein